MSSMNIYEADILTYKYFRAEYNFSHNSELIGIAKDLIYQNYWCDCVMYEFLRSNKDIKDVIKDIKIKSWDEFFDTGYLW